MKWSPQAGQWHRLWSLRLAVLAAALAAAQAALPLWHGLVPGWLFASLSSVVGVGAAVARVIHQQLGDV